MCFVLLIRQYIQLYYYPVFLHGNFLQCIYSSYSQNILICTHLTIISNSQSQLKHLIFYLMNSCSNHINLHYLLSISRFRCQSVEKKYWSSNIHQTTFLFTMLNTSFLSKQRNICIFIQFVQATEFI